ncbi:MAG: hypothetical protein KAR40_07855 [Candidatus Sabulitectum sp.]|nr:hypothetical protein [Candidatus Sabulitectum sp.]
MAWYKTVGSFFGKMFVGEKGIVEQISDVTDKWMPSKTTIHKMSIEDQQAGDDSQKSARAMILVSHDSWLDIAVDALNRMVRPAFTVWAFGLLLGWWAPPDHLATMAATNPVVLNILWTIVTFWFGSRMLVKDIPAAVKFAKQALRRNE